MELDEKLEKGKIVVIEGGDHRPVSALAVKIVHSHGKGAIIMDGSSTVDPYFMVRKCKEKGANERQVLDKILVSRAFTSYQFVDLIGKAERLIEEEEIGFLGVVTLSPLFEDDEMDEVESRWLRSKVLRKMKQIVRENGLYSAAVDPETHLFRRRIEKDDSYRGGSQVESRQRVDHSV